MVDTLATISAVRDQTAAEPATQQTNQKSEKVGLCSRFKLRSCGDQRSAMRTAHRLRIWTHGRLLDENRCSWKNE